MITEIIADKFQTYIKDLTKGLQDLVDRIKGAENENENVPFFIGDNLYATTIIYTYQDEALNTGNVAFMFYAMDISVNNNILTSSVEPFGRCDFDTRWSSMTEEQRNATELSLNEYVPEHLTTVQTHEGDLRVTYYTSSAEISVVYGEPPVEHTSDVYRQLDTANNTIVKNNGLTVIFNNIDYSVDVNGYISIVPSSDMWNLYISEYACRCIKGYPVILTSDNTTFINNFITNNGATNNYTGTYTTPDNETIDYYYGDNYIIINPSGKVSYNDVKTVLDTAVNKINEDNDTNITVPTYNENKYGDNMDKNHEIDMPVSKYSTASGMVYYYQLEPDDVWKVRDGLNTINLDPLVLKDVTRNLISYKLFALDKTALMDEHTPVIVHIGGREIKYNDASIPAEYIKTVKDINLGAITINRIYHDYRDYAPYVKLELFVPFCGWTSLPSWCMDTTITGTMFIDLMNGSCKAVIKANSTVVCEIGGVCAYDVPFVADATGSKASSLLSKVATTAGAVASGNPLAIATTGISLATAMNDNYTRMMGVCGDGSNINGLDRMYVKITRVSWTNPFQIERPYIYKHTYGIPCGKSLTLTAGDGYTQIMDANITGAMTDREKQMITDGFRHGLIL